MLKTISLAGLGTACAAMLALTLPGTASAAADTSPRNAAGEAELAKILEGRVAGEPERCLRHHEQRNMEIVDGTALVFRDGDTIYVNRPSGANFLSEFDIPVFRLHRSELCRLDMAEMRDQSLQFGGPRISLNDFVPYRLPKDSVQ